MSTEFKFFVNHYGDDSAGQLSFSNVVTVVVDDDPGGEAGEFEQFIGECLAEWK